MPEYRRFIAYFYEYIDGKKQKNAGFVKVELRNGMWRILFRLTVQMLPEPPVKVYGFVRAEGYQLGFPLGVMRTGKEIAEEWAYRADTPIGLGKYYLEQFAGIRIQSGDGRSFVSVWDDEALEPDKFVLELPKQEKTEPGENGDDSNFDKGKVWDAAESGERGIHLNEGEGTGQDRKAPDEWKQDAGEKVPVSGGREPEGNLITSESGDRETDVVLNASESGDREIKADLNASVSGGRETGEELNATVSGGRERKADLNASEPRGWETEEDLNMVVAENCGQKADRAEVEDVEGEEEIPEKGVEPDPVTAAEQGAVEDAQGEEGAEPEPATAAGQAAIWDAEREEKMPPAGGRSTGVVERKQVGFAACAGGKDRRENSGADTVADTGEEQKNQPRAQEYMEQLFCGRQHFQPFQDEEVTDCIQITPCDLVRLQQHRWQVGRSSFLQHGYYQYRHLLLRRAGRGEYVLGVPGLRNAQEQYLAQMFGFERFKVSGICTCGRVFGYWLRTLREPEQAHR